MNDTELAARNVDDVILCDLMMPGMSGMDWFAWLCTYDRELAERVVFVTGAFTQQARDSYLR